MHPWAPVQMNHDSRRVNVAANAALVGVVVAVVAAVGARATRTAIALLVAPRKAALKAVSTAAPARWTSTAIVRKAVSKVVAAVVASPRATATVRPRTTACTKGLLIRASTARAEAAASSRRVSALSTVNVRNRVNALNRASVLRKATALSTASERMNPRRASLPPASTVANGVLAKALGAIRIRARKVASRASVRSEARSRVRRLVKRHPTRPHRLRTLSLLRGLKVRVRPVRSWSGLPLRPTAVLRAVAMVVATSDLERGSLRRPASFPADEQ